jgi:hypothetical protein
MKYSETDLEILYNAKTLFYEIGHNNQPVKFSNTVGDNHGNLLHIGIRDGKYNICYYIFVGDSEVEECIAGQKLLLKLLNNGNIEPIESGIDTENIFNQLSESEENWDEIKFPVEVGDTIYIPNYNIRGVVRKIVPAFEWERRNKFIYQVKLDSGSLMHLRRKEFQVLNYDNTTDIFNSSFNESIKKIIKEEIDEFEWAKDIVSKDFSYRPDGRRPQKNEKIRIISEDPSWLAEYQECFENPKDITVTVIDQATTWINATSTCDYGANQYNQYYTDFYVPFTIDNSNFSIDNFGITILPYLNS